MKTTANITLLAALVLGACATTGVDQDIAKYTEAIRLDPNNADAYTVRGVAYIQKKDYDRAIADCTEALRLNPNIADEYRKRGFAYYDKGD